MNSRRFRLLAAIGTILIASGQSASAQFYGGGFGGYYGGPNMTAFSPAMSIGGYYPYPYSTMFPGTTGGFGGMGYGPYGGMGYAYPYGGYGNLGWRSPRLDEDLQYSRMQSAASQGLLSGAATGLSGTGLPAQSPSPQVIHSGAEIKLACPKAAGSALTYRLNGTTYTIEPGYSQTFRDDRTWRLEFRRGGDGTELVTYTLKPGTFRFAVGTSGWELRQVVTVPSGELQPAPQPAPESSPAVPPSPGPTT